MTEHSRDTQKIIRTNNGKQTAAMNPMQQAVRKRTAETVEWMVLFQKQLPLVVKEKMRYL
jgi:hypothetical protein